MKVIQREFKKVSRSDVFTIIPIGDVHIGAGGCDEELLKSVVARVKREPNTYWIGMGDYCDFINVSDRRVDFGTLADWIELADLMDLAKHQKDRFLDHVRPIASKCLALVKGNHEDTILKKYERDIYYEIVSEIKEAAQMNAKDTLAVDYYGWLYLIFRRGKATSTVKINLHHGYVGGKLAGAKALNMQRWLWTHDCDIALFGHSHNTMAQIESVEGLDRKGNLVQTVRRGAFCGTFLNSVNNGKPSGYAERKGYFPLPLGGCEILLKPGHHEANGRVRILT